MIIRLTQKLAKRSRPPRPSPCPATRTPSPTGESRRDVVAFLHWASALYSPS